MAEAVAEEYRSSLADLNFNSKPHINMLTMLAEDNVQYAPLIVDTIINHIKTVPPDLKLPSLYLVDSIMKNIGGKYIAQFSKHMIELFSSVFEKVEEATRSALYKLRQTWNEILPKPILYGIDCRVNSIDPAWPITAQVTSKSIHINPKFVGGSANKAVQELVKETEIKKKQEEMRKKIEEKAEREKMLKLIEEKRAELRALEAKKLKHLQQVKQLHQNPQNNTVVHRDPRLKKAAALFVPDSQKMPDKGISALHSVVVVPSPELKTDDVMTKSLPKPTIEGDASTINAALPSSAKIRPEQNRNLVPRVPLNKNTKNFNNKRTFNSKESISSAKKICKNSLSVQNIKNQLAQTNKANSNGQINKRDKPELKEDSFKKQTDVSNVSAKSNPVLEEKSETQFEMGKRLPQTSLFLGSEDKDYRKITMAPDIPNIKEEISQPANFKNLGPAFYQSTKPEISLPVKDIPGDVKENLIPTENVRINPLPQLSENIRNYQDLLKPSQNADVNSTGSYKEPSIPTTQSFKLDGKDRIIHFVDKRAFTFMDDKEPHELSFIGPPKNIFVEGLTQPFPLAFDGKPREFDISGTKNTIQFGTPSREIYINNCPYEVKFGGPPLVATLENNKLHRIGIDGPPPQVLISEKPAYELYEAYNRLNRPLHHPQTSNQNDATSQDVDMRMKNAPLKPPPFFESTSEKLKDIDWRHPPVSDGQNWNLSQASLNAVKSSMSSISNSTNIVMSSTPFGTERFPAPSSFPHATQGAAPVSEPAVDIGKNTSSTNAPWTEPDSRPINLPMENSSHIGNSSRLTGPLLPPPSLPPTLSSLPPPPPLPNLPAVELRPASWKPLAPPPMFPSSIPSINRHKIPLLPLPTSHAAMPRISNTSAINQPRTKESQPISSLPPPIDVGSIFEKLVAAGIITKTTEDTTSSEKIDKNKEIEEVKEKKPIKVVKETIIPKIEFKTKSLKKFYPQVLVELYKGSQCATCGMRYKNSQGDQYRRHLDWHFRMNRREKDGAKKAFSRRLFYELKDWIQFTEIEEAAERAPSYFELQADGITLKKDEIEKIHSVRASECETEKCSVCGEKFQLFWVEEEEEWHLRHAVRHDGEAYHPACYEDFKKASEKSEEESSKQDTAETDISKEEEEDTSKTADVEEEKEEPVIKMEVDEEDPAPPADEVPIKEEPMDENDKDPNIENDEKSSEEEVKEAVIKEEPPEAPEEEAEDDGPSEIIIYIKDELLLDDETMDISLPDVDVSSLYKPKAIDPNQPPEEKPEEKKAPEPVSAPEDEESEEEEFRPPTPDPRFEVLPPTFKGTELSALCTIM